MIRIPSRRPRDHLPHNPAAPLTREKKANPRKPGAEAVDFTDDGVAVFDFVEAGVVAALTDAGESFLGVLWGNGLAGVTTPRAAALGFSGVLSGDTSRDLGTAGRGLRGGMSRSASAVGEETDPITLLLSGVLVFFGSCGGRAAGLGGDTCG
eukprot:CAMPEP_0206275178 /NCGR_PEP_ID=MMETSP0047_2-20121206/35578_1 /ASSEMBLY_ACC=CAM_ASM_000192 /TAXON_ID=195065 /ORGANISM="Chroomonas mesostigmatica_cf, Strain CCMP1168" /LENGTH=151 /DNA_ID=CAMNT_0053704499 /DNA_START=461 /DNA_END=913 /DNA_ORIENTATION=+